MFPTIPDDDSSLSSLLTSQSNLRENWVQLVLFPRISAAKQRTEVLQEFIKKYRKLSIHLTDTLQTRSNTQNAALSHPQQQHP